MRSSSSAVSKRKEQNKEAQRRFRAKQARLAQQSKEDFEKLSSKLKDLIAENETLREKKSQDEANMVASPPSHFLLQSLTVASPKNQVPESPIMIGTPQGSPTKQDTNTGAESYSTDFFGTYDLDDIFLPQMSLENTNYEDIAFPNAGQCTPKDPENSIKDEPSPIMVPDAQLSPIVTFQSAEIGGLVDTGLDLRSTLPGFESTIHSSVNNNVNSYGKTDLIQALLQLAYTQERVARIELEKSKLEVWRTHPYTGQPVNYITGGDHLGTSFF